MSLKQIVGLFVCVAGLAVQPAYAGTPEVLSALQGARAKVVALVNETNKGAQTVLVDQIKSATADVNKQVADTLANGGTSPDVKAKLGEFKLIWVDFQHTRDTEIIPAALAGQTDKAKEIAQGVQVERFKKMAALLQ